MIDLAAILRRYADELPGFRHLAQRVREQLRIECLKCNIPCRVDAREKDPGSLAKKALLRANTYEEITDKAGARIVLLYPDDRDRAISIVRGSFTVLKEDDKQVGVAPDVFRYSAFHFEVDGSPLDGVSNPVAEIQVHTPGEALWAGVSHDLIYKAPSNPPETALRAISRVRALTEVADSEITRIRDIMNKLDKAKEQQLLVDLERHYFPVAAADYNRELSLRVLGDLLPGIAEFDKLSFALDDFVRRSAHRLEHIYNTYRDDQRNPVLWQPEAILVFWLIENHQAILEKCWPPWLGDALLGSFFNIWGEARPSSA